MLVFVIIGDTKRKVIATTKDTIVCSNTVTRWQRRYADRPNTEVSIRCATIMAVMT